MLLLRSMLGLARLSASLKDLQLFFGLGAAASGLFFCLELQTIRGPQPWATSCPGGRRDLALPLGHPAGVIV